MFSLEFFRGAYPIQPANPARAEKSILLGTPTNRWRNAYGTWILVVVFSLALMPYIAQGILMYADEPHYLNAGFLMCQFDNYLMPLSPNEAPMKDFKPILTYWIIALSVKLLGPSLFATHLPYLLAAVAVVWLTYRLAKMLSASPATPRSSDHAGPLACAILLCNPLIWLAAIRCMPDIWLVLFLLMSTNGFLGLLTMEAPTNRGRYALLAYVGVSLGVLTKGIPALIFLGYVFLFASFNPWRRGCLKRLFHLPSMALATGLTLPWFIIVYFTYGSDTLQIFWKDQIGERAQSDYWLLAVRFLVTLAGLALFYFPLCWPLWKMRGRSASAYLPSAPEAPRQRIAAWFIISWVLVNVLAMSSTANWSIRYLLPVFPPLAALLAIILTKVDADILKACFGRTLVLTYVPLTAVALVSLVVGWQLGMNGWEITAGIALLLASAAVFVTGMRGQWLRAAQSLPIVMLLVLALAYLPIHYVVRPDLEETFAKQLRAGGQDAPPVAVFIGDKGPACRLRLALGFPVKLLEWRSWPPTEEDDGCRPDEWPALIILPEKSANLFPSDRYTIHAAASLPPYELDDHEWPQALREGRLKEYLGEHRIRYSIAVRRDSAQSRTHASAR